MRLQTGLIVLLTSALIVTVLFLFIFNVHRRKHCAEKDCVCTPPTQPVHVRIRCVNMHMLPMFPTQHVPHAVFRNADVLVMQEIFSSAFLNTHADTLRHRFPHKTFATATKHVLRGSVTDSGLAIAVNKAMPVKVLEFSPFKNGKYVDSFASKGVVVFCVAGIPMATTHFQATYDEARTHADDLLRLHQFSHAIDVCVRNGAVFLAGDINTSSKSTLEKMDAIVRMKTEGVGYRAQQDDLTTAPFYGVSPKKWASSRKQYGEAIDYVWILKPLQNTPTVSVTYDLTDAFTDHAMLTFDIVV